MVFLMEKHLKNGYRKIISSRNTIKYIFRGHFDIVSIWNFVIKRVSSEYIFNHISNISSKNIIKNIQVETLLNTFLEFFW